MSKPLTLREQKNLNSRALCGLMRLAGKPIPAGDPLFRLEQQEVAKRKPAKRVEKDIQDAILTHLRRIGWVAIRHNSGAMRVGTGKDARFVRFNDAAGHSDISGIAPGGRAYFIEVKRPGEKPTHRQAIFLETMARHGAHIAVIHSMDELFMFVRAVTVNGAAPASATGGSPLPSSAPPIIDGDAGMPCRQRIARE